MTETISEPEPEPEPEPAARPAAAPEVEADPDATPATDQSPEVESASPPAPDTTRKGAEHIARPLTISSALAVGMGVLAVLLVANTPGQLIAVGIAGVGVAGLVGGLELRHRGHRLAGSLLLAVGVAGALGAIGWAIIGTAHVDQRIEVLPGVVGLALLGLGVGVVRRGTERRLLSAGAAGLLLTVFVSGLVEDASVLLMLAATVATVLAWDCGEQAVNMGEQVGRQAVTWRVEVVHGAGSLAVGAIGVVVALAFVHVGVTGVPLLGLAALLGAAVALGAGLSA